jgi:transcriptional regulator with XRE-family HTH domain
MKSASNRIMTKGATPGALGRTLSELRAAAGVSLYELGRRSGVHRIKLLRIENGVTRYPTVETLNKIAAGLAIDPTPLLDAAWAEHTGPVPSLRTYLRSRYRVSATQIDQIERVLESAERSATTSNTK